MAFINGRIVGIDLYWEEYNALGFGDTERSSADGHLPTTDQHFVAEKSIAPEISGKMRVVRQCPNGLGGR